MAAGMNADQGKNASNRDDRVIPGETAVSFHVVRDPMQYLAAHRKPQKLSPRRDRDRDEPGQSQNRQSNESIPPVQPF